MMFWRKQPLLKNYVSETDRFLAEFDKKAEATSFNREQEEAKYERLNELRDNPLAFPCVETFWGEDNL